MNPQTLKSKVAAITIPKATFDDDESGTPVNSFFRPLLLNKEQIELKFKGTVTSPIKKYDTAFGSHMSFAVRVETFVVDMFDNLVKRLHDGAPVDEEWIKKDLYVNENIIIIKTPMKKMLFAAKISGIDIDPFNLDGTNFEKGDKVQITGKLGCWFMRNQENKYGLSLTAKAINWGEATPVKRKKSDENDEITVDSDIEIVDQPEKKKRSHNKADRDVLKAMNGRGAGGTVALDV